MNKGAVTRIKPCISCHLYTILTRRLPDSRCAPGSRWRTIVDIIHSSDWLNFALVTWVVISLLATPLVGRFLVGALRERTDQPQPLPPHEQLGTGQPQATVFPCLQADHNGLSAVPPRATASRDVHNEEIVIGAQHRAGHAKHKRLT